MSVHGVHALDPLVFAKEFMGHSVHSDEPGTAA
jgi:hypothetical protein